MNLLDNAFGIHEQALQVRSRRVELLAKNIANADTPNFKAKDIDFKTVLSATRDQALDMQTTQLGHYSKGDPLNPAGELFRVPFNTSFDGNTVEIGLEQSQYGKAAADFQATLSFLENRVSGLRKALRGD
jgi:flagellar basal-body rod protein FlgB